MPESRDSNGNQSFKQRKTFAVRKEEVQGIRQKFPNKVPVIVERFHKESSLPMLDKSKFLIPQELTMSVCYHYKKSLVFEFDPGILSDLEQQIYC
uniref:Autophagy-related protein n=1 Tax=Arion vulgaris TaxID=1028688 RepID=A0A0B7ACS8_9EUPU